MTSQMNEIEMLREERMQLHSALANLLNAYGIISEAYFRLATESYQQPRLSFIKPNLPEFKQIDSEKEYEAMEKEVMSKPLKDLKIKKSSVSYLG